MLSEPWTDRTSCVGSAEVGGAPGSCTWSEVNTFCTLPTGTLLNQNPRLPADPDFVNAAVAGDAVVATIGRPLLALPVTLLTVVLPKQAT